MSGGVALDPVLIRDAPNFRDLGGLPLGDGDVVAPGRLYRSEGLQELTDDGVAALGRLGVRLVCDLRTPVERERQPSRWPDDGWPEVIGAQSGHDIQTMSRDALRGMFEDESGGAATTFMRELYAEMPATYGPLLAAFAERIADEHALPAVVHCRAGKDRTGFVCSMLLLALGADRATVAGDYIRSDEFFGADRLGAIIAERAGRQPPAPMLDAFRVKGEYLDAAIASAEAAHGTVDAYLATLGIDDARRARLREALVD